MDGFVWEARVMVMGSTRGVLDGPRVSLRLAWHVYPEIVTELLGRVADSVTGHPWHVATSLLGDDSLLVVGLSHEELQVGLAAERAVWRAAARAALNQFDLHASDQTNCGAIDEFSEAFLRAEQVDLLLAAVQESARRSRHDETRLGAPGCDSLPPDTSGLSGVPGASRHDSLDARGVDVDAAYERQVQWLHDRHHGTGVAERDSWGWS